MARSGHYPYLWKYRATGIAVGFGIASVFSLCILLPLFISLNPQSVGGLGAATESISAIIVYATSILLFERVYLRKGVNEIRKKRKQDGRCPACEYSLVGFQSRCPECGELITAGDSSDSRSSPLLQAGACGPHGSDHPAGHR